MAAAAASTAETAPDALDVSCERGARSSLEQPKNEVADTLTRNRLRNIRSTFVPTLGVNRQRHHAAAPYSPSRARILAEARQPEKSNAATRRARETPRGRARRSCSLRSFNSPVSASPPLDSVEYEPSSWPSARWRGCVGGARRRRGASSRGRDAWTADAGTVFDAEVTEMVFGSGDGVTMLERVTKEQPKPRFRARPGSHVDVRRIRTPLGAKRSVKNPSRAGNHGDVLASDRGQVDRELPYHLRCRSPLPNLGCNGRVEGN